jgi:hypothetical protein
MMFFQLKPLQVYKFQDSVTALRARALDVRSAQFQQTENTYKLQTRPATPQVS